MGKPIISFDQVVKRYDDETVLKKVSFEIEQGKFYTLLGPSGCGKTTILKYYRWIHRSYRRGHLF